MVPLEWVRVKTATATYLKNTMTELERFGGELGHLNRFLKRGDQIHAIIEARISAGLDMLELDWTIGLLLRKNNMCQFPKKLIEAAGHTETSKQFPIFDRVLKVQLSKNTPRERVLVNSMSSEWKRWLLVQGFNQK